MTRTRVILATLACVAFLAVSAGPAAADGYAKYCKIQISGIPQDCKGTVAVYLPYGTKYGLQNGDYFVAKHGYPIKYAVRVGKFYGPWCDYKVECDATLNVSSKFCVMKVLIPENCPGTISIYGYGSGLRLGSIVCLPRGVAYQCRARVGDVHGPWWYGKTVDCNEVLDASKKFCAVQVNGIPENCRGVIDLYGIGSSGSGLINGNTRCFPNYSTIKCRARLEKINGPWHYVQVKCEDGKPVSLNVAKKFVNVKWAIAWAKGGETRFRDTTLRILNGGAHCFPKGAKVYAAPYLGDLTPAWDIKCFYENTCVYWKLYCVAAPVKPAPAPE